MKSIWKLLDCSKSFLKAFDSFRSILELFLKYFQFFLDYFRRIEGSGLLLRHLKPCRRFKILLEPFLNCSKNIRKFLDCLGMT